MTICTHFAYIFKLFFQNNLFKTVLHVLLHYFSIFQSKSNLCVFYFYLRERWLNKISVLFLKVYSIYFLIVSTEILVNLVLTSKS